MPIFTVAAKTHQEKPGDQHKYTVTLRNPEGHTLKLIVSEYDFQGYIIGDSVDVKWGRFQQRLTEVPT